MPLIADKSTLKPFRAIYRHLKAVKSRLKPFRAVKSRLELFFEPFWAV